MDPITPPSPLAWLESFCGDHLPRFEATPLMPEAQVRAEFAHLLAASAMTPLHSLWPTIPESMLPALTEMRIVAGSPHLSDRDYLYSRFPAIAGFFLSAAHFSPAVEAVVAESINTLLLAGVNTMLDVHTWCQQIRESVPAKDPRLSPENLPENYQALARSTVLDFPDRTASLWDFIVAHTESVAFVEADAMPPTAERIRYAIANPIFRSTLMRRPGDESPAALHRLLARLGHEAYHHFHFWRELAENPQAAVDPALQEPPARALERKVLRHLQQK